MGPEQPQSLLSMGEMIAELAQHNSNANDKRQLLVPNKSETSSIHFRAIPEINLCGGMDSNTLYLSVGWGKTCP